MTETVPSPEDVSRARRIVAWAGNGLEIFRYKLAVAFAEVRGEGRAACAAEVKDLRARFVSQAFETGQAQDIAMLATEARDRARARALEEAATLVEQVRCRVWTPAECAMAIRGLDHPPECSCHRWVDCRATAILKRTSAQSVRPLDSALSLKHNAGQES